MEVRMKTHLLILLSMAFVLVYSACSSGQTVLGAVGLSSESPLFIGSKATSATALSFQFSLPVQVVSVHTDPVHTIESVTEGDIVEVNFVESLPGGERLVADVLVEDKQKNTLNVVVPIRARNDRIPLFVITEVRTEYSKPKVEFIEIKTKNAGNMGGVRLFAAINGMEKPLFEFPPTEVSSGEYIVVHLRSIEEGLINETGTNRDLSKGTEALPDARDFWVPGTKEVLRKTDAVFFMDQDNKVIDALLFSEEGGTAWAKAGLSTAAELLGKQSAWAASTGYGRLPLPNDALISKSTTATRTICRNEMAADSNRALDWYITASSNATPGKPNSTKRYEAK
jgi:hypothetical protein